MNTQERVATYVKLRDYKDAANKEFKKSMERVNLAMKKLEGDLMIDLEASGGTSFASPSGTVYVKLQSSATVKDRDAFLRFALQSKNLEVLDVKANKKIVRELSNGGTVVPGVNYTEIKTVGVRRGKDNG